jgi:hypothetical protein
MKKLILTTLLVALAAFPASAKSVLDFQTGTATYTDPLVKQKNFEKLVTDIGLMTATARWRFPAAQRHAPLRI